MIVYRLWNTLTKRYDSNRHGCSIWLEDRGPRQTAMAALKDEWRNEYYRWKRDGQKGEAPKRERSFKHQTRFDIHIFKLELIDT